MKTISLKVPDDIYEKIETYRKLDNKNRTSYVMEAVVAYTKNIEREELKEQLKNEAIADKEADRRILDELDHLSNEGLDSLKDKWS
ncbi:MAG: hypothetical protein JXR10_14155 [Cyclobacteriaceae bacterium]